ncbi:hypothetical protein WICPIJ_005767 [Wickerhamomyces pijperi]|uniref:Autophagy protein Atg19/Atg34 C-terminal domain-containing protein n=1 Tax=Wickerhamomyces pijperi TaxID=599730 RepID=A0A9P8Q308_WICPI|nr:hypothetical protein WICPIJ_005767 [Wickerhamomyces pijperi]
MSKESATTAVKITYQGVSRESDINKHTLKSRNDLNDLVSSIFPDIDFDCNTVTIKRKSKRSKTYVPINDVADFKGLLRSLNVKNYLKLKVYSTGNKSQKKNKATPDEEQSDMDKNTTKETINEDKGTAQPEESAGTETSSLENIIPRMDSEYMRVLKEFASKFDTNEKICELLKNNERYSRLMDLRYGNERSIPDDSFNFDALFESMKESMEAKKRAKLVTDTPKLTCQIQIEENVLMAKLTNKSEGLTPANLLLRFTFITESNESVHVNFNLNDTQLMASNGLKILKHNLYGLNLSDCVSSIKYSVDLLHQGSVYARGSCLDGSGFCLIDNSTASTDSEQASSVKEVTLSNVVVVDDDGANMALNSAPEDFVDVTDNMIMTTDDELDFTTEDFDYEVLSSVDEYE